MLVRKWLSGTVAAPTGIFLLVLSIVSGAPFIMAQDGSERLDIEAEPIYGTINLQAGFDQPYHLEMVGGGTSVDLFRLTGDIHQQENCAGFSAREPALSIVWSGSNTGETLTILFEGSGQDDDPTMVVHVIGLDDNNTNTWCSDDSEGRLQPTVEVSPLPDEARIIIWIGSYYPGIAIPGTLYVFQTVEDSRPPEPTPTPAFGSIWSDTVYLGSLHIEEYCRDVTPSYPDARPYSGIDLSWGCWYGQTEAYKVDLTEICIWEYGEGSYAVQTGDTFWTYACYSRGDVAANATPIASPTPTKTDYFSARNPPIGAQAMVVTGSGEPYPVRREPEQSLLRFAQLQPGTIVDVVGGPIYADGYIWWQIRTPDGQVGWGIAYADQMETLVVVEADTP